MLLKDKVAIVTGATKGVGRATALRFAEEGATVVLASRNAAELRRVAQEIEAKGGSATPMPTDITSEERVRAMVEGAFSRFGRIDVLVNSAGTSGPVADLVDLDTTEWDRVVNANLKGVMLCCKHVLRSMAQTRSGSVINVTSTEGRLGAPGRSALCASLWAVHALTQSLAWEAGKHNIRVNCVAPGPPMTERLEGTLSAATRYPAKSTMDPTEAADVIVYLASDSSYQTTGQAINVNGGSWFS